MTCRYCGAALPPDALFCGACGRSVSGERSLRASSKRSPVGSSPLPTTARGIPSAADEPADADAAATSAPCPQCAAPIAEEDVFCRECGFVLRTAPLGAGSDTEAVEPLEPSPAPSPSAPVPPPESPFAPESGSTPDGAFDSFPWGLDLVPRRTTAPSSPRERFVLQFSTGESVTVSGTGLIGRNPVAQPGEFLDQFVVVGDIGKSVSKTHLEFGQDDGVFWVSDRHSTNGSVIRLPDAPPRRCEPDRRYRLERGSRVDIGEQFFVVS